MKKKHSAIIRKREAEVADRLSPSWNGEDPKPVLSAEGISYEVSEKIHGVSYGGLGLLRQIVKWSGLGKAIDQGVKLFKRHQPYHESDHVLSLIYNVATGGTRYQDIEMRRQSVSFLEAVGAEKIPAPSTAGDFVRRFQAPDVIDLMEAVNESRRKVWAQQPARFFERAEIDVDGTIAPTSGECKEGMEISYDGQWGYAPLIVTLAQTGEVLYAVNGHPQGLDSVLELFNDVLLIAAPVVFPNHSRRSQLGRRDIRDIKVIARLRQKPLLAFLDQDRLAQDHQPIRSLRFARTVVDLHDLFPFQPQGLEPALLDNLRLHFVAPLAPLFPFSFLLAGAHQLLPIRLRQRLGPLDEARMGIHPEVKFHARFRPAVKMSCQRKIRVPAQAHRSKTRLSDQLDTPIQPFGGSLMRGAIPRAVDGIEHLSRLGQRHDQRCIAPLPVVADLHPFLAFPAGGGNRAIHVDLRPFEEPRRLLGPDLAAALIDGFHQIDHIRRLEAAHKISGRAGRGDLLRSYRFQEADTLTPHFDILIAGPARGHVVDQAQHVVRFVVRLVAFEQLHPLINRFPQPAPLHDLPQQPQPTVTDAVNFLRDLVADAFGREDRFRILTVPTGAQPISNFCFPLSDDCAMLFLHLKCLLSGLSEVSLLTPEYPSGLAFQVFTRGLIHFHLLVLGLDEAWKSACRAARVFPEHMPYYRARARLTQAEVRLAQNLPEKALEFVSRALSTARMEFYVPLLVKGHTLHARTLFLSGDPAAARVQSLRALQLARMVDRPALRADAYQVLAQSEVATGDQEKGLRHYSRALQILKERSLHLSLEYRDSFTKRFIAPLEAEREKAIGDSDSPAPKYLIRLRGILGSLKEIGNPNELGEQVLEAVAHSLPEASANLFVRQSWSGRFQLVASKGQCLRTGRHLLPKPDSEEGEFISQQRLSEIVEGQHASPIYLYSGSHVLGLLYLECGPRGISEVDMDFLLCIAAILEIKIQENLRRPPERREGISKLDLHPEVKIIGKHPSMTTLLEYIRLVAPTEATVLITGESGTGKELVAAAVHHQSLRSSQKYIPINCGALPSDLIESELFGHMQGSFTGAVRDRPGLFEAASGGTLFLDEISTLPFELQARLLRVLESKKIRRVGDTKHRPADVRIIAATNQPLDHLVEKGEFREDLYHRLNVYLLQVPPLRERTSDIPILIDHFLQDWNHRTGKEKGIAPEVIGLLSHYHFPGNVRELENIIASSFHLSGGVIEADVVAPRISGRLTSRRSQRGSRAEAIYEDLVSGRAEFWSAVRDSFLNRDLTRDDLKKIVSLGLTACKGSYRKLLEHFRMPQEDYKKFLTFLTNYDCKLDFRPFRKQHKVEV